MRLKQSCLVDSCKATTSSGYCTKHREQKPVRRFNHIKRYSKIRNIPFKLSYKHFLSLIKPNVCYYCKGKLRGTGGGLDRLDSSKGYTRSNVVACCLECNVIKSNLLTAPELLEVIKLLIELRKTNRVWYKTNPQTRRRKNGIQRRK